MVNCSGGGIKRQLTAALSAPAEPGKGGGGLEVKQRRYIMIKGSWKREKQKAKVRKRTRAKALGRPPLLLGSVIHHHHRVP